MREFYEWLLGKGEEGILDLIARGEQEGLQLDFKTKRNAGSPEFQQEDKQVLAKAVSAFSNSAGGVIIWGVTAKPGIDKIDCAQNPPLPITNIRLFKSQAVSLTAQLLQPKHDSIEIEHIDSLLKSGCGYLVIFVPRSDRRPHRSEAVDQKQYFKRSGDNSFAMEHYDIEDAFSRTASPELDLHWGFEAGSYSSSTKELILVIRLKNISNVIAKYPYIIVDSLAGVRLVPHTSSLTGMHVIHQDHAIAAKGGRRYCCSPWIIS